MRLNTLVAELTQPARPLAHHRRARRRRRAPPRRRCSRPWRRPRPTGPDLDRRAAPTTTTGAGARPASSASTTSACSRPRTGCWSRRSLGHPAPREQLMLRLRFYEEMTQHQIAERLGISQMHVSRLLARCLDELRRRARASTPERSTRRSTGTSQRGRWSRSPPVPRAESPSSSTAVNRPPRPAGSPAGRCGRPGCTSNGLGGVGVDQEHLELVAVAAVDQPGRVEAGDAVLEGQAAAGLDEPGVPGGEGDGDAGRDEGPAAAGAERPRPRGPAGRRRRRRGGRRPAAGRSGSRRRSGTSSTAGTLWRRPYGLSSPGARLDGPRDDRPRPRPPRHRRDRHARHRRRPRDRGRGPRPGGPPAAEALAEHGRRRARDAHEVRPARRHRARRPSPSRRPAPRRWRSSRSTSPTPAPCRCAATRSAPTAGSSPPTCPRSRSTCTTARSTCPPSRSWPGAGTPSAARRRAPQGRPATGPSTTSARASTSCASTASACSSRRRPARRTCEPDSPSSRRPLLSDRIGHKSVDKVRARVVPCQAPTGAPLSTLQPGASPVNSDDDRHAELQAPVGTAARTSLVGYRRRLRLPP